MKRCMVDLETVGTVPGSVIFAIGAVMFDEVTKELGGTFYAEISQHSCIEHGLTMDSDTIAWWNKQDPAAKQAYMRTKEGGHSLPEALAAFSDWLSGIMYNDWLYEREMEGGVPPKDMRSNLEMWGNGSDFDNAFLQVAYRNTDIPLPWKFWNNRCYRTLKGLYPVVSLKRVGTHHNALDDAKSQALHAISLLRMVRDMPEKTLWRKIKDWLQRESRWVP